MVILICGQGQCITLVAPLSGASRRPYCVEMYLLSSGRQPSVRSNFHVFGLNNQELACTGSRRLACTWFGQIAC